MYEIGNWKRTSELFWTALISTAGKRRNCMTVVISNAGFKQSWPYQVREAVRQDPNWYFHSLNGPVVNWIGERQLSEQRRLLPHQQYARLWENVWSSGTGDGLNPAWVEDALRKPDGTPWLEGPMPERLTGRIAYAGGLDCGWRSDHSALCIMAYHTADRRYELVDVKSWDPKDYGGELPLGIIRDACREAHGRYRLDSLLFDDSGFIDSGQQLADLGVPMSRFHKENPAAQTRRCRLLIEAFRERNILLYDTDPHSKLLIRDLHLMSIVERIGCTWRSLGIMKVIAIVVTHSAWRSSAFSTLRWPN